MPDIDNKKYGLPKLKKYPMPDAAHVRSAIKFFNYVTPANEEELAKAIIARMEEYGISPDSMNIGDENRFKKYVQKTYLKHHGILGQKWGVRRYQNPDGTLTKAGKERYSGNAIPPNTKFLKDYSGPAYFISSNDSLSELNPRVPDNYFTKNGYEDNATPRISFAPSIDKCLAGLSQNVEGNTYSVYKPIDISKHKVFKPNPKAVPDSLITDELWICESVKLEKVGSIKVTGNRGQAGKKFSYGDKTAELYDDWTYEMKEIRHSDLYLQHHGIKGQKWGVRRYQNPDGSLTEAGKKRQYKQDYKSTEKAFKKAMKSGDKNTSNRSEVGAKIQSKIIANKDVKEYDDSYKYVNDMMVNAFKEQFGVDISKLPNAKLTLNEEYSKWLHIKHDKAKTAATKIAKNHIDEYASATLKDIGVKETKAGHDYMVKYLNDNDFDTSWYR